MKINSLKKQKHSYLIQTGSDKAFKGSVVNLALPSLHGGSVKITLTEFLCPRHLPLTSPRCE